VANSFVARGGVGDTNVLIVLVGGDQFRFVGKLRFDEMQDFASDLLLAADFQTHVTVSLERPKDSGFMIEAHEARNAAEFGLTVCVHVLGLPPMNASSHSTMPLSMVS